MSGTRTTEHYGTDGLGAALLAAVDAAHGADVAEADLAGVDQFHLGGRAATSAVLSRIELDESAAVLDVGCGIGGVARQIASTFGCAVVGVDLTPVFVDAAQLLSDHVGLGAQTRFEVANALDLPFDDGSFDLTSIVHVGMNVDDKASLAVELRRVTRPGGRVVIYDIVRRDERALVYPTPWASDAAMDFIARAETYADALERAGCVVDAVIDHTVLVTAAIEQVRQHPPKLNLGHLMGPDWPIMFGNLVAALQSGTVAPVEFSATA